MPSQTTTQIAERIFSKTKPVLDVAQPLIAVFSGVSHGGTHRVDVEYPCRQLLGDEVRLALEGPHNALQRFDPTLPLVPDAAVTARAGRGNDNENGMTSYHQCTGSFDGYPPFGTFHETMEAVLRFSGYSEVKTVVYTTTTDPVPRLRIQLSCQSIEAGPNAMHMQREFNMLLAEYDTLDGMIPNDERPQWADDLDDVLTRISDRACRHVADHYYGPHGDREHGGGLHAALAKFGKIRHPKYAAVIPAIVTRVDTNQLSEDDRACPICAEKFLKPGHEAVVLESSCGHSQHLICQYCVLNICETKGPKEACCPQCRAKFFITQAHLDFLVFGIQPNGKFLADPLFTKWENFQRSCSDLDKQSAINAHNTLALTNPSTLFNIWLTLISDDLAIDGEVSDKRLDCTPEFRTLVLLVEAFFRYEHGRQYTTVGLRYAILEDIHSTFTQDIAELVGRELDDIPVRDPTQPIGVGFFRPGMAEAIERSLERFCRVLELRLCECGKDADEFGRHFHGDRYFWDPREVGREQEILWEEDQLDETIVIHRELMRLENEFRIARAMAR
ncbi:hypothetical protein TI39_contig675g00007 [Zymoseptoria brevis]|uniref:RING-type domain-containing protein n=1 Tax=Zymoseptoria brevis TaxID=1047168 RepID=A0A0F4GH27_9PEZI|nr:hypothetical protein TI39_contig675g00007 [Zymoseptoria brevis]